MSTVLVYTYHRVKGVSSPANITIVIIYVYQLFDSIEITIFYRSNVLGLFLTLLLRSDDTHIYITLSTL